ncbi:PIN domain-containing protein [Streptomyces sp. NPDC003697]
MIILDTNILHSFALDSVSTDLLTTIRTSGVEDVAVPWVVLEELTSHRAVPYRKKYEAAQQILRSVRSSTPWPVSAELVPLDLERFQDHWREKYRAIVDVIPTSERALAEAVVREANALAPCKSIAINDGGDEMKIGGRDAAIWLTAIEYAREHPGETVYFVSRNWKDFTKGASYPYPMDKDLEGIEDRFVHLTSLEKVVARFATQTEVDEDQVRAILSAPETREMVSREAWSAMSAVASDTLPSRFECTTTSLGDVSEETLTAGTTSTAIAQGWLIRPTALFDSMREVKAYRIGDHVWCTATVRWFLGGPAFIHIHNRAAPVGCAWDTRVLVSPTNAETPPTLLRSQGTQAITATAFATLPVPNIPPDLEITVPRAVRWANLRAALEATALPRWNTGSTW